MVTYYYEAVKELLFGDFVDNLNGIMAVEEYISISFYLNEITFLNNIKYINSDNIIDFNDEFKYKVFDFIFDKNYNVVQK